MSLLSGVLGQKTRLWRLFWHAYKRYEVFFESELGLIFGVLCTLFRGSVEFLSPYFWLVGSMVVVVFSTHSGCLTVYSFLDIHSTKIVMDICPWLLWFCGASCAIGSIPSLVPFLLVFILGFIFQSFFWDGWPHYYVVSAGLNLGTMFQQLLYM